MDYIPAELNKSAFHCLHCGAYAKQTWKQALWHQPLPQAPHQQVPTAIPSLMLASCEHCGKFSIWLEGKLKHPAMKAAPAPHPDMPQEIKADYDEARAVFQDSPRSSAALLRLAIQSLCIGFGQPGKNLNADIGELVNQGLPVRIQQSLDIVRVVGNNQVHPGTLDVRDDPAIALALFGLVNIIIEDRITRPKEIEALYSKLPETSRKAIEERDAKAKTTTS
jgi:Domain of unknown function (DUF4145)